MKEVRLTGPSERLDEGFVVPFGPGEVGYLKIRISGICPKAKTLIDLLTSGRPLEMIIREKQAGPGVRVICGRTVRRSGQNPEGGGIAAAIDVIQPNTGLTLSTILGEFEGRDVEVTISQNGGDGGQG